MDILFIYLFTYLFICVMLTVSSYCYSMGSCGRFISE